MLSARGRHRWTAVTAVLALAATLLIGSPSARADESAETPVDRARVLLLWKTGGPLVKPAAEQALLGTDDDVRAFFGQLDQLQVTDDQIVAVQVYANGGPALRTAALTAIDADRTAAFLDAGWQQPTHMDQRVRVTQMLSAGGPQLRLAAQKALDADDATAADYGNMDASPTGPLDTFLGDGWRAADLQDKRVQVTQIYAKAPPNSNVRRLALRALDADTAEVLGDFLDTGYAVAAARDEEATTIADLVAVAERASADAEHDLVVAQAQSAKAAAAGAAAKRSAQAAIADMIEAKDDAALAAKAARKAKEAAEQAANAADQAIAASRDAVALSRVAAAAAARASALAAMTRRAANRANKAAAQAAVNGQDAKNARDLAKAASDAGKFAKDSIVALQRVNEIAVQGQKIVEAAKATRKNATDALDEADKAVALARKTGVNTAAAEAAARKARQRAAQATRAAESATRFALAAVNAAKTATEAAMRAADEAISAAANAIEAAEHAGDASRAATAATNAANAATTSADAAVTAANQAYQIYEAARVVDADRIALIADQGAEAARGQLAAYQEYTARATRDVREAAKRDAETNRLIAQARDLSTDRAVAVAAARRVALIVGSNGGPHSQEEAWTALSGTDDEALAYIRTGIDKAAAQDDRAAVQALALDGTPGMVEAATKALTGSDAEVTQFLRDPVYAGRGIDDRVAVTRLLAQAQANSDTATEQQAQKALDSDDAAVRAFLLKGRFATAEIDEQVKVNRIIASTTPGTELYVSAVNALDGPPGALHEFLVSGQYAAAQNDFDAQRHNEEMLALLQKGFAAAQSATQNAEEAQAVAATARKEEKKAREWSDKALLSAKKAIDYMDQARASAQQAEDSAGKAIKSQEAAVAAANRANKAAEDATRSANRAQAAYDRASAAAQDAVDAGNRARRAALAAGKNEAEAAAWYTEAKDRFDKLALNEFRDALHHQQAMCISQGLPTDKFQRECFRVYEPTGLKAARASLNRQFCDTFTRENDEYYRQCVADSHNPLFMVNRATDMVMSELAILQGISQALGVGLGLVVLGLGCAAVCTAALTVLGGAEVSMGIGGMFDLWLGQQAAQYVAGAAIGGITGGRILGELKSKIGKIRLPAVFSRVTVPSKALDANLVRMISRLGSCANSFVPGTAVLMGDGSTKPIEDVRVGDRVLSTDPQGGVTEAEPVTDLIPGTGYKDLTDVVVDTDGDRGEGTASVTATANHPFWVADLNSWQVAADLQPGQWLRTGTGTWVQVAAVWPHKATTTVHNLSVAGHHTYYVVAGGQSLLVHNAAAKCPENIALGYRVSGLREWARGKGYKHFLDLREGEWEAPVKVAIQERDDYFLRVYTQGFATGKSRIEIKENQPDWDRFLSAVFNGFSGKPDATEKEMFWIVRAMYKGDRKPWENIKFYDRNGELQPFPKVTDWYNLFQDYAKRPTTPDEIKEFERRNKNFKFLLDPERFDAEFPNG